MFLSLKCNWRIPLKSQNITAIFFYWKTLAFLDKGLPWFSPYISSLQEIFGITMVISPITIDCISPLGVEIALIQKLLSASQTFLFLDSGKKLFANVYVEFKWWMCWNGPFLTHFFSLRISIPTWAIISGWLKRELSSSTSYFDLNNFTYSCVLDSN